MRLNFKERRTVSSEELSQKEINRAVENAELQLAADISATKYALADKKDELEVAMTTSPLNTKTIIDLQVEVENLEDGLKRLEKLQEDLCLKM